VQSDPLTLHVIETICHTVLGAQLVKGGAPLKLFVARIQRQRDGDH
jgi:hypothetical protein